MSSYNANKIFIIKYIIKLNDTTELSECNIDHSQILEDMLSMVHPKRSFKRSQRHALN